MSEDELGPPKIVVGGKWVNASEIGPDRKFDTVKEWVDNRLAEASIDTGKWGTGTYKTIEDLTREVYKGDCRLEVVGKELIRVVFRVGVDVYGRDENGKERILVEERQVFTDGRERTRDTGFSLTEKMRADALLKMENPELAVLRALAEELGIDESPSEVHKKSISTTRRESDSYPGLPMEVRTYAYEIKLASEQYRPEGYVERDWKMTTYFGWKDVERKDEQQK